MENNKTRSSKYFEWFMNPLFGFIATRRNIVKRDIYPDSNQLNKHKMENEKGVPVIQTTNEPMSYPADFQGPQRDMTFGEKLVGLTLNPSNDDKVGKAKRLCADLADLLASDYDARHLNSELQSRLFNHAVGEILNAQMNVVKVLTLKY